MKFFIKEIVIEKDKKITQSLQFNRGLSVVEPCEELYDILKWLLGWEEGVASLQSIRFFAVVEIDEIYYIRGKKEKNEHFYNISVMSKNGECKKEYFEKIAENEELNSSLFFQYFKRQNYPHRLFQYKNAPEYYSNGEFSLYTNGYGSTRSFRGFLANFIKHFKPIRLRENKDFFLKLNKSGEFNVGYLNNDEKVLLSESENVLYHYFSFISIADFWDRAERIRNMHQVKMPLVVATLLDHLDESINLNYLFDKTNRIDRQIIIFNSTRKAVSKYKVG